MSHPTTISSQTLHQRRRIAAWRFHPRVHLPVQTARHKFPPQSLETAAPDSSLVCGQANRESHRTSHSTWRLCDQALAGRHEQIKPPQWLYDVRAADPSIPLICVVSWYRASAAVQTCDHRPGTARGRDARLLQSAAMSHNSTSAPPGAQFAASGPRFRHGRRLGYAQRRPRLRPRVSSPWSSACLRPPTAAHGSRSADPATSRGSHVSPSRQ